MAVPWLRILDALIGVTDLARSRRIRTLSQSGAGPDQQLEAVGRAGGGPRSPLEARLAGVVVAALKETFDRDSRRLELERAQIEAEKERADRSLKLELLRQAGEREIGRLRLLAAVAVVSWISTLFLAARLIGGSRGARLSLGGAWMLLLLAVAMSFVAQSRVGAVLDRGDPTVDPRDAASSGVTGALALWLIVLGLALVGLAVLMA